MTAMKTISGQFGKTKITITYGLQYLKGNKHPYFSITGSTKVLNKTRWVEDTCGCIHDTILKYYPGMKPLVDLHLSNHEGIPMHFIENGLYYLSAKLYLVQNGKDPMVVAKEHFRCTTEEIDTLYKIYVEDTEKAAEYVKQWIPRYKQEADEAIKNFGLTIPEFPN